jgi:hypothetical protein
LEENLQNQGEPAPKATKRILCLANSRKHSGRCIAGREILNGQPGAWIRPVSAREHQEVSESEWQYPDGSDPMVLDLIHAPLVEPHPHNFQQENGLLDPNFYWQKVDRCDWAGLQVFLDPVEALWINGQSTYNGLNDRIALAQANELLSSLRLIHVDRLAIRVFRPNPPAASYSPKRKVQGQFEHAGVKYWLSVTDPVYEKRFLAQADGNYELGESCLAISLGEPYEGFCYKLIACIIEREQV